MIFVLQLRDSHGEPRWRDAEGQMTAYLYDAQRFTAIPAACAEAFFVIDPPLPPDIWERWAPYVFMNTGDDLQGLPIRPPLTWRRVCTRLRRWWRQA